MGESKPTIGRVVRYVLTESDISEMNALITAPHHYLNGYAVGEEVAAEIVRVFVRAGDTELVNLKCRLDGTVPDFWRGSREKGLIPGTWHWPNRD